MTSIVVESLQTTHEQVFNAKRRLSVYSIEPYLYKKASPAGDFFIEIYQGGVLIAKSNAVTSSDIDTNTAATDANWYHGYYKFLFTGNVVINKGDFTLKLTSSGYTFSGSSEISWVKPHENINIPIDYIHEENDEENPFGVNIWTYEGKMTRIIDITDGFSSASAPSISTGPTKVFAVFADDAAYVTDKGSVATDGDTYYNSTDNKVRIYEDGNWVENASFEA